jgi:hypothetical protein
MHIIRTHKKSIQSSRTTNYITIKLHVLSPAAVFLSPAQLLLHFKRTPYISQSLTISGTPPTDSLTEAFTTKA